EPVPYTTLFRSRLRAAAGTCSGRSPSGCSLQAARLLRRDRRRSGARLAPRGLPLPCRRQGRRAPDRADGRAAQPAVRTRAAGRPARHAAGTVPRNGSRLLPRHEECARASLDDEGAEMDVVDAAEAFVFLENVVDRRGQPLLQLLLTFRRID